MGTNHVIHAQSFHENLSPQGFRRWAQHYRACRQSFVSPDPGFSTVPYFLNCRAIELELKARHLETVSQAVVRDFEHNLEAAYLRLPNALQTLTRAELRTLRAANHVYKGKGRSA